MPRTIKDVPPDARVTNILKLGPTDLERTENICRGNIANINVANLLFNSQQAKGTSKAYGSIIAKFQEFCTTTEGCSYVNFGEKEVGGFVLEMVKQNLHKNTLACIKPAIERIERVKGIKDTAFTPLIISWLCGAKRLACEIEPRVKKMEAIPLEAIKKALREHIWVYVMEPEKIDFKIFRTVYRWVVMAFTLCRFDDFAELRAKHFQIVEGQDAIQIFFPRSKNDQFHNGMIKMLPRQDDSIVNPLALTLLYFKKCGFQMNGIDDSFINCRMAGNVSQRARGDAKLSYSEASKQAKLLLAQLGFEHIRYGESSAKRTGVTVALNQEVPIDTVQQVGGWRTQGMPLTYMSSSVSHKIKIVKDMKIN